MAAAETGLKPARFIMGMVKAPEVVALATALPLMVPSRLLAYHRHLGRASPEAAGQGQGQVGVELAQPAILQKGPEQHKEKDQGSGNPQGYPEQALLGHDHELGEIIQGHRAVAQSAGDQIPEKGIGNGRQTDDGQAPTQKPPSSLQNQEQGKDTDEDVSGKHLIHEAQALDESGVTEEKINSDCQ